MPLCHFYSCFLTRYMIQIGKYMFLLNFCAIMELRSTNRNEIYLNMNNISTLNLIRCLA